MCPSASNAIPRPPPELALSAVSESDVPSGNVKISIGEKSACSHVSGFNK